MGMIEMSVSGGDDGNVLGHRVYFEVPAFVPQAGVSITAQGGPNVQMVQRPAVVNPYMVCGLLAVEHGTVILLGGGVQILTPLSYDAVLGVLLTLTNAKVATLELSAQQGQPQPPADGARPRLVVE